MAAAVLTDQDRATVLGALGRMAQLEKVAELARPVVARDAGPFAWTDACHLLELALVELDHHPDTRETNPVDPTVLLDALTSPSAEEAARRAWDSWRGQRGPSVTEDP